jgi:hypothetical protein
MFSGSRCCLRTKVNRTLLSGDTPTPLSQPLLFLYPRWFTTQLQYHSTPQSAHEPSEGAKPKFNYTPPQPSEKLNAHVVEQIKLQHVSQQPSQNPSETLPYTFRSIQPELEKNSKENLNTIMNKRKARQGIVIPKLRPDGLRQRVYLPARGCTSSIEQCVKKETSQRSAWSILSSWERTLNMLANSVPYQKEAVGHEIWLSKQALIALSGTSGTNSWVHNVRGGCEVQVTDIQSSCGKTRQVLLQGSARAISLTTEHFAALQVGKMRAPDNQSDLGSTGLPPELKPVVPSDFEVNDAFNSNAPVRIVLTAAKRHLRQGNWMRVDELPEPATYTVRSFKEYVEDLTSIRAPRLVGRELYGAEGGTHNMLVADVLCRLFTDTQTAKSASAVALNLTFAFLCKHTELVHHRDQLYNQCQKMRLTLQPQTYNYILRASMLQKEMTRFGQILDDLLSDGHMPDHKVWLTLMKSGSSMRQKRAVADWMRRKDLLGDNFVTGEVAAEMISVELGVRVHEGIHPDLYIESIDARFGQNWMSQSSVTRSLMACSHNKAWSLAVQIFQLAQRRGVNFDHTALPPIFGFMQQRGSLRDSLDLLRSHLVRTTGRDDRVLTPIIFMTAWKHRFYNVSRVLWRYTAVQGAITYKMQNVVTESLLRNQDTPSSRAGKADLTPANLEWRRRAGKVLVGTDLDTRGLQQVFHLINGRPGSTSVNPMVWLAQYTSDGGQRDQQSSLAYVMMHRDLDAWKYYAPPSRDRLLELLSDAYAMDVRWKSEGIGLDRGGKSTQWMIENAIDVPFVKREISVASRRAQNNTPMSWSDDEQGSVSGHSM